MYEIILTKIGLYNACTERTLLIPGYSLIADMRYLRVEVLDQLRSIGILLEYLHCNLNIEGNT